MLFSTKVFLFIFLPIVLAIYYVFLKKHLKIKNTFLLIVSLFFYAWAEYKFVFIMMFSIIINWTFGILINKYPKKKKFFLWIALILNLGLIFIYKYLTFVITNLKILFNINTPTLEIPLPLGISFFTFQSISYIIDVYKGKVAVQKNLINLGLYIAFFPQLIAGPIVRYDTIEKEINHRTETFDKFSEGVNRFIIGLGKKVIIANNIAIVADKAFELTSLSVTTAWMGIIAYALQILFDFSGYSDMAIGLGKMFGFDFLENFNYPYISKSISEFWRRWHISLGTWFKDYVYIPLGGNRVSKKKHIINLLIVWSLTGLWHGASWTFILWGIMYFILISFEKFTNFEKHTEKLKILNRIYTLFFVLIGWVLFRSNSPAHAITYMQNLFGIHTNSFIDNVAIIYLKEFYIYFILGIIFSIPWIKMLLQKFNNNQILKTLYSVIIILIFVLSISYINENGYNPFIYFNF